MILGLCKQIELQKILDKLPKEKSNEPEAGMGSDTEIGVMEPSGLSLVIILIRKINLK